MRDGAPFRDVAGTPKRSVDAHAWEARWAGGETPWDRGEHAPPFETALADGLVAPPGRALVPGCGRGHDARLLARAGFDVTALDLSATALAEARALAEAESLTLRYANHDLLALPDDFGDPGGFDLVLEHTCFCAIDPRRRDEYVEAVTRSLAPGGRLLGLFLFFEADEGPPFGASREEIEHRFAPRFSIDVLREPDDSWESRRGREWLVLMTRR